MQRPAEVIYLCPARHEWHTPPHATLLEYFNFELTSLLDAYKRRDKHGVHFWKKRAKETRNTFVITSGN